MIAHHEEFLGVKIVLDLFSIKNDIILEIMIKNKTESSIFYVVTHSLRDTNFKIIDKSKRVEIPLTPLGKSVLDANEILRRILEEIKAGKSYKFGINLNEYFELENLNVTDLEITGIITYFVSKDLSGKSFSKTFKMPFNLSKVRSVQ